MKKIFTLLSGVLIAMAALPACAQRKDEAWQNRFTAPALMQPRPQKDPAYIYHKKQNDLKPVIERKIEKQKIVLYANKRVMRLCREWQGCEEWARGKYALDTSFRITDAEVEYYSIAKGRWIWQLYVQTRESNQMLAYEFYRAFDDEKQTYNYPSPRKIDVFPGHPFPDHPSQHAQYKIPAGGNAERAKTEVMQRWPGVPDLSNLYDKAGNILEEQRVFFTQEGPIWKRTLQIIISNTEVYMRDTGGPIKLLFSAVQKEPNGPYTYERDLNFNHVICRPDFYFLGQ